MKDQGGVADQSGLAPGVGTSILDRGSRATGPVPPACLIDKRDEKPRTLICGLPSDEPTQQDGSQPVQRP